MKKLNRLYPQLSSFDIFTVPKHFGRKVEAFGGILGPMGTVQVVY